MRAQPSFSHDISQIKSPGNYIDDEKFKCVCGHEFYTQHKFGMVSDDIWCMCCNKTHKDIPIIVRKETDYIYSILIKG